MTVDGSDSVDVVAPKKKVVPGSASKPKAAAVNERITHRYHFHEVGADYRFSIKSSHHLLLPHKSDQSIKRPIRFSMALYSRMTNLSHT